MQNEEQINVKRGLNSAPKPWTQFNYNIAFKVNGNINNDNIH